jgi:hypothetical protein
MFALTRYGAGVAADAFAVVDQEAEGRHFPHRWTSQITQRKIDLCRRTFRVLVKNWRSKSVPLNEVHRSALTDRCLTKNSNSRAAQRLGQLQDHTDWCEC